MPIRRLQLLVFALAAAAAASCTDTPSESGRGFASLALVPVLSADGIAAQQVPITRIRLAAKQVSTETVIETETFNVDSNDEEWRLDFGIPVPSGPDIQALVTIELLAIVDGVETVQWSGVAGPFTLSPGPLAGPTEVPLARGPLDNLNVTGVNITQDSPTVDEGRTVALSAQVLGGSGGTVVFWTSLDPDIATVNDLGVVTGVTPGSARIVATAGRHSDQVSVAVAVRVAQIQVAPPTATLTSFGATQTYTARALDPRGAEVPNVTFEFSVTPATVATHEGNGVMRATGNGTATVTATARGTSGNANLTVQQAAASIVISPPNPSIQNIGGTVTLTAVVRDANNNAITGAPVTWTSLTTNIATVGATTGVVLAVGSGVAQIRATSGSITATVNVSVGSQVFFTDGLETGTGWVMTGIANRTNGVGITNTASPVYVTVPGVTLPPAPQGAFYLWFGTPAQGNYMGVQDPQDIGNEDSGGTSLMPMGGSATSPPIVIPSGIAAVFLSFQSWFEIESFNPGEFDLMTVEIRDANTDQLIASKILNTGLIGAGETHEPETSAGGSAEPVSVPIQLEASGVAGRTIRVRFTFDTGDVQFNGFRGWVIDNIRVATTPAAGPPAASLKLMELCSLTGCVKPNPRRR